jgi:hypothetical protein
MENSSLPSWDHVFAAWTAGMHQGGCHPLGLFKQITLFDPKYPDGDRETDIDWLMGGNDLLHYQCRAQNFLFDHPGTIGLVTSEYRRGSRGQAQTLELLIKNRHDEDATALILLAAALHENSLGNISFSTRNMQPLQDLQKVVYAKYYEKFSESPYWHHTVAHPIPGLDFEEGPSISNALELAKYLGEETAAALKRVPAIMATYGTDLDPKVKEIFEQNRIEAERQEQERQREAAWAEQNAVARAAQEARMAEIRKKMAAKGLVQTYRSLESMTKAELTRAVWSKPTADLALELGVSDVTIAKRCKALSVEKPPRGFWAKVNAGQIPHPNGKPVKFDDPAAEGPRHGR